MTNRQQFVDEQGPVRRTEYDDGSVVLAADLGPGRSGSVDVVGDTVIVVVGDDQYEFELAGANEAQALIKNGVLTVEVEG